MNAESRLPVAIRRCVRVPIFSCGSASGILRYHLKLTIGETMSEGGRFGGILFFIVLLVVVNGLSALFGWGFWLY